MTAARLADRPISAWRAESLDEVDGRHFPLKSNQEYYNIKADPPKITIHRQIVVDEVHFDRPYPASTFWPMIGPKDQVTDLVKLAVGRGNAPDPSRLVKGDVAKVVEPVRAVPHTGWAGLFPGGAGRTGSGHPPGEPLHLVASPGQMNPRQGSGQGSREPSLDQDTHLDLLLYWRRGLPRVESASPTVEPGRAGGWRDTRSFG